MQLLPLNITINIKVQILVNLQNLNFISLLNDYYIVLPELEEPFGEGDDLDGQAAGLYDGFF